MALLRAGVARACPSHTTDMPGPRGTIFVAPGAGAGKAPRVHRSFSAACLLLLASSLLVVSCARRGENDDPGAPALAPPPTAVRIPTPAPQPAEAPPTGRLPSDVRPTR